MTTFLCWAPERGGTLETASMIRHQPGVLDTDIGFDDGDAAEVFVSEKVHAFDPLAEDESVVVHVKEVGSARPPSVWRVTAVARSDLVAEPVKASS